jgi:hypothetical protein
VCHAAASIRRHYIYMQQRVRPVPRSAAHFLAKFEKMAAASPNPLRSTEGWDLDRWVEVRDEP